MNYYRLAQSKYKKALRVTKLLRYVPGVRMIAVCNTLSYNRAGEESDIDLFLITQKGRVWVVRFFSLLLLKILRLRPSGNIYQSSRDKICLSFFVGEDGLNLDPYKIASYDPYLSFWIRQLKPLYNEGDMYKKFVQENQWAYREENTAPLFIPNYKRRVRKSLIKPLFEWMITSLDERIYRSLQMGMLPKGVSALSALPDSSVIIGKSIIKLHTNDRRIEFKDQILKTGKFYED